MNQEILLGQKNNASDISNNSNNFRQLSINENCNNITLITPANSGDTSHLT